MAGLDGFGTALAISDMDATAPTFTDVGKVTNISGLEQSREAYDVTAHDSADGYREFIGGIKDGGEVSFDVNFDPDEHVALTDTQFARTAATDFTLTYPNGAVHAFSGVLTSSGSSAPHDDKLQGSLTIKVSGKPTFTPSA